MPAGLIGGILGGIGALGKIAYGIHENSLANKIDPQYVNYETSPYAKKQLGFAEQLYNGRMAGATDLERNILSSAANNQASTERNATDGSQALLAGLMTQGQANSAFGDLQTAEKQNKYGLIDNLNNALKGLTAEGDKVYADKQRKFEIDTKQKDALRSSAWQNIFGGVSDISGGLIQGDTAGMFGGGNGGSSRYDFPYSADYSTAPIGGTSLIPSDIMKRLKPSYSVGG